MNDMYVKARELTEKLRGDPETAHIRALTYAVLALCETVDGSAAMLGRLIEAAAYPEIKIGGTDE